MAAYLGLGSLDLVDGVAALDVKEQAKVLASLGNGHDVWKTWGGQKTRSGRRETRVEERWKGATANVPMRPAGNVRSERTLPSTSTCGGAGKQEGRRFVNVEDGLAHLLTTLSLCTRIRLLRLHRPTALAKTHLALLQDHLDLVVGQGVLEAVAQEDDNGHALAELVRASGRARGVATGQFVLTWEEKGRGEGEKKRGRRAWGEGHPWSREAAARVAESSSQSGRPPALPASSGWALPSA